MVEIIDFDKQYSSYFRSLNEAWLEKYFTVEPVDVTILDHPFEEIIQKGGDVIFARLNGDIVGTCALKLHEGSTYELTKMAVTPTAQGLQIGKKLALEIIRRAKDRGAECLFLESNRRLLTALNLYTRLGFIEKQPPFEKSAYARADIYMELPLW